MARRSLLRHMFKHGPLSKIKNRAACAAANKPQEPPLVAPPIETATKDVKSASRLEQASVPVQVQVLPKCNEDPLREPDSLAASLSSLSSTTNAESTTSLLPAQNTSNIPDFSTITTRDLVYAAMDEAISATHAHLTTLETMLALLETIRGFSDTVEVLKGEMIEKKRACHVAIKELEGFEEGVERMHFADDGVV